MRNFGVIGFILLCSVAYGEPAPSVLKKRVNADLDCIQSMFEVKYAPKPWKEEFAQWRLDEAIGEAKSKLSELSTPSLKDCQIILRDFFNSTRDYHVGVKFYSTESASLPFLIKGSQGRYFVCFVDRELVSPFEFPFEEGDEITAFDGRPIHEVITELRYREFGENTFETDQALAELSLTHRRGCDAHIVPKGTVKITGLKKGSQYPKTIQLSWDYSPEKIRDYTKLAMVSKETSFQSKGLDHVSTRKIIKESRFFDKCMVSHLWDKSYVGASTEMNKHSLGARSSYIPALGGKTWKSGTDMIFDAYIFTAPSGKRIGYIRVPHYLCDEEEVEEFGEIMNDFEQRTDALVLDQINNPGGSVFYLYALASILADKPFHAPKHHVALTQEEVYMAHVLLFHLDPIFDDISAREALGTNMGGYPVDFEFATTMKKFCTFLINQWEAGKVFTDPTFLYGVDMIKPHPEYHYSKPVLMLINSLDFSGGDFFPAILQDNQRVTLLGTRTAGAGGYVLATEYPNHSGMKSFIMTGSLAKRTNQKPIENLGVKPDILYELTPNDLQNGYKDYVNTIVKTVDGLAQGKK